MKKYLLLILFFTTSLFLSSLAAADLKEDICFRVGYRSKDGVGFNRNYGTLGLFYAPVDRCQCGFEPLVDLRGHLLQNGRYAANAGIGARGFLNDELIYGLNVFYDYRNTSQSSYSQIGFGGELLSCCFFDTRVNVYLPFGKRLHTYNERLFLYEAGFFARSFETETLYRQVQLEFGKSFETPFFTPYFGIGTYYLKSHAHKKVGEKAVGGMWRLTTTFWNHLTFEVVGTHDHIFKNRWQFYLGLDFSIFSILSKNISEVLCQPTCKSCCDRLRERIYRNELIVLKNKCLWETNYKSLE